MGYFNDPFMSYFVRKAQRRSPLINRGERPAAARRAAADAAVARAPPLLPVACARITSGGSARPCSTLLAAPRPPSRAAALQATLRAWRPLT